ncbi:MAG: CHAP domain-containing protein [Eubacteriaceae bacterium]|uniref:CHAP domain-containing protein n=1 Tax=Candidatus Pseudoramibacter fermentans TaxID=2594427 RepID=A0A6L5GRR3_9FIRM|nr:CHAP domain-containing protein [Candidatus Pseudoramibacter fermentans]RRF93805.1 MAG: CHAP domain-containing protein [Eubacteriaceae bacterium]
MIENQRDKSYKKWWMIGLLAALISLFFQWPSFAAASVELNNGNTFVAQIWSSDQKKVLTNQNGTLSFEDNANTTNQAWTFIYDDTKNVYSIVSKSNAYVLTVGSDIEGAKVSSAVSKQSYGQMWNVFLEDNNMFSLRPSSSLAKVLTIDNNNVLIKASQKTSQQKFKISILSTEQIAALKQASSTSTTSSSSSETTTKTDIAEKKDSNSTTSTTDKTSTAKVDQTVDTTKTTTNTSSDSSKKNDTSTSSGNATFSSDSASTTEKAKVTNVDLGDSFTARIKHKASGKSVAVGNSNNVVLQSVNNYKEQGWQFKKNSDGSYTIYSLSDSKKVLDVYGILDKNGANIQICTLNNGLNQKFYIRETSSGSGVYYLQPECSKTRVMDLTGNNTADNSNIELYTLNNSAAQQFTIEKANASGFKTKPVVSKRQKVINIARSQIGTKEGSNNYTKYGVWYGNYVHSSIYQHAAWCAMFVSWCGNQAGLSSDVFYYHAYCPSGVSWYQSKGRWQWKGYVPKMGDIVYYDWNGDRVVDHVGLVESYSNGNITTIEGNYSDQVKRRTINYKSSSIFGYATPNY